jgi:hypothetical protein
MPTAAAAQPSIFERHPKKTLACAWLVFLLLLTVAAEVGLKQLTGMGRPVLFEAHPAYGYRLRPNQETWRFGGAHFKINNLGLRANGDWDARTENKVLFLGDSVTYGGNNLSNEHLFSEVAVRALQDGLVAGNAGIPNWGVENIHGLVVQGGFLPASTYVTTLIEHDFYRGLSDGQNKPWIKYEPPLFALQEMAEFVWHKYFRDTRAQNLRAREREPRAVRTARAAAKLKAMDELLKARGYRHLILISPTLEQVLGERERDAQVASLLRQHGLEAVYLLDAPRVRAASAEEKRSWYQDDVHLTLAGHAVWGELIAHQLHRHRFKLRRTQHTE